MKLFKQLILFLFILTLLALCSYGTYWLIQYFSSNITTISSEKLSNYIIIGIIGIVCTLILSRSILLASARNNPLSLEKKNTYDRFIELFTDWEILEKELGEPGMMAQVNLLKQLMVLWASDNVLKAFINWHSMKNQHGLNHVQTMAQGEKVLLAIRKEINRGALFFKTGEINTLLRN